MFTQETLVNFSTRFALCFRLSQNTNCKERQSCAEGLSFIKASTFGPNLVHSTRSPRLSLHVPGTRPIHPRGSPRVGSGLTAVLEVQGLRLGGGDQRQQQDRGGQEAHRGYESSAI